MILNALSNFLVEEAGGKALPLVLDVRDEQQVKSVVQHAVEKVIIALDFFSDFFFLVGLRPQSEPSHHPVTQYLVMCYFLKYVTKLWISTFSHTRSYSLFL